MKFPGFPRFRRGFIEPLLRPRLSLAAVLQGQWESGVFGRYDILLRTQLAKQWLATSSAGIDWEAPYRRMQELRAGRDTLEEFQQLVESVKARGFDHRYPVGVTRTGRLLDGAHRVAVALALDLDEISVDVRPARRLKPYGREWFVNHEFSEPILGALDDELEHVMAFSGADVLVLSEATKRAPHEWLPEVLPPGTRVLNEWRVAPGERASRQLINALSFMPWHEKNRDSAAVKIAQISPELSILRIRVSAPRWNVIPKTSTAECVQAVELEQRIARAIPGVFCVVGHSFEQNRAGMGILSSHGSTLGSEGIWLSGG